MTPLLKAENLGRELGLDNLWIKNDSANPTHSFKDRVVSVATTKAVEFEFDTIACASTGNLAGATAAHGAKAGINTIAIVGGVVRDELLRNYKKDSSINKSRLIKEKVYLLLI